MINNLVVTCFISTVKKLLQISYRIPLHQDKLYVLRFSKYYLCILNLSNRIFVAIDLLFIRNGRDSFEKKMIVQISKICLNEFSEPERVKRLANTYLNWL